MLKTSACEVRLRVLSLMRGADFAEKLQRDTLDWLDLQSLLAPRLAIEKNNGFRSEA